MAVADIQTSFAAGELSPQLYARVDLDKFQVGAALLRNYFVDYRGGASNRAGTEYIDTTSAGARLIPFIVSTSAAYVLVFTNQLITIYNQGRLVSTVITPYLTADLFTLAYTQSADVLTIVHPNYPPADLSRIDDTSFSYTLIVTGPAIDAPVIPAVATAMVSPHSGPYSFGYLITAVDLDGKEESLGSNPGVKHSEAMNETTNRVIGLTWNPSVNPVSRYNIYKWGPIDAVTMNPATVWGFIGSSQTTTFTDNNIAPDFSKQPPGWGDPFSGGQFETISVNNGGAGYDGVTGDWPTAIPYVPLVITNAGASVGTGAAGFAVIDHATAKIVGVYLTNPGKNYTAATVTAVGQGGTGATFNFSFTDIQPLNPAATAYLQQRRVFGGSLLKPETLVMSQPGLITNFNNTPVTLATDSIVLSIAAEEVNTIKSFVQVNYGLLAFTTGGSFLINGGTPGAAIDANSPSVQPQVSQGANDLRPLRINYDVIYGQAKGNRIHNLAFAWQKQSYAGSDISTLAAHLFDTFLTIDWAYAEEPFKIVWAVRNDGRLLSLTYVPDQEVYAWCRHDTQGLFQSVCSVPEGDVDAVYVVVERYIPSNNPDPTNLAGNWFYYLERMAERQGCCIFDAWFLDCALSLANPVQDQTLFLSGSSGVVNLTTTTSTDNPRTPDFTKIQNFPPTTGSVSGQVSSIDWTRGRLATYAAGANTLIIWDINTFTQILAPTGSTAISQGIQYGQDGNLYGAVIATNRAILSKLNPTTGAVVSTFGTASAGFPTDASHWALPSSWDVQQAGAVQYLCSLSALGPALNEVAVLNCTTMTWTGFSFAVAENCPSGVVSRGQPNHCYCMIPLTDNGPTHGSEYMGLYDVVVGPLQTQRRVASVTAISIDSTWTHITEIRFMLFDSTDDTLICGVNTTALNAWNSGITYVVNNHVSFGGHDWRSLQAGNINHSPSTSPTFWLDIGVSGPANENRIIKVDKGSGHVMWSLVTGTFPSSAAGDMNNTSITKGQFIYFDTNGVTPKVRTIDTIAGTQVVAPIIGVLSGYQFSNDLLGYLFVQCAFNNGGGSPVPQGATPTTWANQWASFGAAPPAPALGSFTTAGQVIQIGCGKIRVDAVTNSFTATGTVLNELDITIPDDPNGATFFIAPGDWTLTTPVTHISGLSHLNGKQVYGLADGVVVGPFTVAAGAINLAIAATNVVIGLKYTQQVQTLYLTTEGIQEGSDQGKRKQISGVTVRTDCTKGLKAGTDFDYLTPIPELNQDLAAGVLYTGDARVLTFPQWDRPGQVCLEQDDPLPSTILGVIVEVTPGDTGS